MGPNGYNALGNALIQTGGILDQLRSDAFRQRKMEIDAAAAQEDRADDREARNMRNRLLLAQMIDNRVKANREIDAANRKQRLQNNADLKQFAQTSYVAATGADEGNMHITDEGEVNGARQLYDPANPDSIEAFRAGLAEDEIRNREETYGPVASTDVRGVLADANSLNTPAGQRVLNSYYRPENDAANRTLRITQARERIAASAARQNKALAAASQRSKSGGAGLDVPTLEQMLGEAQTSMQELLATAGDNYSIGMDKKVDAQMSVISANIKNIQSMLNRAKAASGSAKAQPNVPGNPLGLNLPN